MTNLPKREQASNGAGEPGFFAWWQKKVQLSPIHVQNFDFRSLSMSKDNAKLKTVEKWCTWSILHLKHT